ncbi:MULTISPECIES: SMP-30/gluconolactonase/LRE family protein [Stenotrophomonas]|uniref:SMP-30/gluconolactonase/LRE family protein n=1 Tax=Stenotrophomonas sp. KCTC 12332 TaxID=1793721 RepID=UPI0009E8C360|nr:MULTISPECIES: SMP-30/gluconolactonase/LRE family protein [Stenotrophomonas]
MVAHATTLRSTPTLWHTPASTNTEAAAIARQITLARLAAATLITLSSAATAAEDFIARDHVSDGIFTSGIEGPATGPDGALYVVNIGKDGTIGRVDADGKATLFLTLPDGSIGNGIRFGRDGTMYIADYARHNILRVAPGSTTVSLFAHLPDAHQPNDIALAPDGTLYASDPNWTKIDEGQLWRIDRDGKVHLLETGMGTTNGIEVSPDGKRVYVNESVQRTVWVYDRTDDGSLANKRLLIRFDEHGMDGMRCDADGNLYIARYDAGVIAVVSPQGALLREVPLKGRKPSNLAFGGNDGRQVFVTLQDRGAVETFQADRPGREYGLQPSGKP